MRSGRGILEAVQRDREDLSMYDRVLQFVNACIAWALILIIVFVLVVAAAWGIWRIFLR